MADERYYDDLETRAPEQRETSTFECLRANVANAKANAPYFAKLLKDVDPDSLTDRAALARLPVTRKGDLLALQDADRPLGGLAAVKTGALRRIFMSPGPIFEPEGWGADGQGRDWWRCGRALYAAGFRCGDIVHNSFAYHLTPAGHMFETGAAAVGCVTFPAGIGNTELQVDAIERIRPTGYSGTPDFLKVLLDKAAEMGRDASSITKAAVSGAALPPSLRAELKDRGVATLQSYGTADLGLVAYETEAMEGMVVDEGVIVEIVRPGTGDPVPEGEVGEIVVTTLNPDYPLVRFGTGDMSAVLSGACPTGRTNMRIKGWMGRADQRTKVKGMFVDPAQVAAVLKQHGEIARARLVVGREGQSDTMVLKAEVSGAAEGLADAVARTLQDVCKVRGAVEIVAPGSLPNDGKVIDDTRDYS